MNGLDNEAITLIYVKGYRLLFMSLPKCQNTLSIERILLLSCGEINNASGIFCHGSLLPLNKWEETRL